jgi:hypothetical protein
MSYRSRFETAGIDVGDSQSTRPGSKPAESPVPFGVRRNVVAPFSPFIGSG